MAITKISMAFLSAFICVDLRLKGLGFLRVSVVKRNAACHVTDGMRPR